MYGGAGHDAASLGQTNFKMSVLKILTVPAVLEKEGDVFRIDAEKVLLRSELTPSQTLSATGAGKSYRVRSRTRTRTAFF